MKKLLATLALVSFAAQAADYPAACVEVEQLSLQMAANGQAPNNMSVEDVKAMYEQSHQHFATLSADEQKQVEDICKASLEAMKAAK